MFEVRYTVSIDPFVEGMHNYTTKKPAKQLMNALVEEFPDMHVRLTKHVSVPWDSYAEETKSIQRIVCEIVLIKTFVDYLAAPTDSNSSDLCNALDYYTRKNHKF